MNRQAVRRCLLLLALVLLLVGMPAADSVRAAETEPASPASEQTQVESTSDSVLPEDNEQLPGETLQPSITALGDAPAVAVSGQVWQPGGTECYQSTQTNWADVCLRNEDTEQEWWTGTSQDGTYAFTDQVPVGNNYWVRVVPRGQYGMSNWEPVTVTAEGGSIRDVTLTTAVISGRVMIPTIGGPQPFPLGADCNPDAGVQLFAGDKQFISFANVDRDGYYALGNLQSGTYWLQAGAWGSANNYAEAVPIEITYSGEPIEQNIVLTNPLLAGQVLLPGADGQQAPLEPSQSVWAEVCLRNAAGMERRFRAEELGRFLIGGDIQPGEYKVWAEARGSANTYGNSAQVTVTLTVGQTWTENLTLTAARLTGYVKKPGGDTFIPTHDNWVDIFLRQNATGNEWWTDIDGEGKYLFADQLPAGEYTLYTVTRGLYGASIPLEHVQISDGAPTQEIDLYLTPAMITGRVLLPDGLTPFTLDEDCNPDAGVQLYSVTGTDKIQVGRAHVDRNGYFSFGGNLASGTYYLCANSWGDGNSYTDAEPIEIDYQGALVQQNIALTSPLVTGRVLQPLQEGQQPVFAPGPGAWADVVLRSTSDDSWERRFEVRWDGSFIIGGAIPNGDYRLWAEAGGDNNPYTTGSTQDLSFPLTVSPLQVDLSLSSPTLSGYVLTPAGGHFAPGIGSAIDVRLRNANGQDVAWTNTDSFGRFKFGQLDPGSYTLLACDLGDNNPYARSLPTPITITTGVSSEQNVALTAPVIIGRVLQPDGQHFVINERDIGMHIDLRTVGEQDLLVAETEVAWWPNTAVFRLGGNIQPGQYRLFVNTWGSKQPYANAVPLDIEIKATDTLPVTMNILLTERLIVGQVTAPDGSTLSLGKDAWVDVCLRDLAGQDLVWTGTDQQGNFVLGGDVDPGNYLLYAFARGTANLYSRSLPLPVAIGSELPVLQNVALTVPGEQLYQVSGTVSLPEGEMAGESGLSVTIRAIPRVFTEQGPLLLENEASAVSVLIPAGEVACTYTISAPLPPERSDYLIQYLLAQEAAQSYPQYRPVGFFSAAFFGHTVQFSFADELGTAAGGNYPNRDLIITKLRSISGTVGLPVGQAAPEGGLAVDVYCISGEGGPDRGYQQLTQDALEYARAVIPAGQNSTQFTLNRLSPNRRYIGWQDDVGNLDIQGYRLMYHYLDESGHDVYGFFHSTGSVARFGTAERIDVTDADKGGVSIQAVSQPVSNKNPDVSGNDVVDLEDLAIVALGYGTKTGQVGFSDQADLNGDGRIDLFDLVLVAKQVTSQLN